MYIRIVFVYRSILYVSISAKVEQTAAAPPSNVLPGIIYIQIQIHMLRRGCSPCPPSFPLSHSHSLLVPSSAQVVLSHFIYKLVYDSQAPFILPRS